MKSHSLAVTLFESTMYSTEWFLASIHRLLSPREKPVQVRWSEELSPFAGWAVPAYRAHRSGSCDGEIEGKRQPGCLFDAALPRII